MDAAPVLEKGARVLYPGFARRIELSHAQYSLRELGVEVEIRGVALDQFDKRAAEHRDRNLAIEPHEKRNDEPFAPPVEERLLVAGTAKERAGVVVDPSHGGGS